MSSETMWQLQQYLAHPRFEVLPLSGVTEQLEQLPTGTTVTVTSSPTKGPQATFDLAAHIQDQGMHAVPHLAARLLTDGEHLASLMDRMAALGLSEVFVVAGDSATPVGAYPDALSVLYDMEEQGCRPQQVGIAGYPERHAFISDAAAVQAMADKAAYADYIVSQICYDPSAITSWLAEVRARGIELPIHIGAAGVVDIRKLLRISMKIGLGDSMRFLRKQHGMVTKLLSRYTPDELIDELADTMLDPAYGIAGWHFYTFNEIPKTYGWTQQKAAHIQEVPA